MCCCDDKGYAGCVVGSSTVSGDASGVDVINKEVKRPSAGSQKRETHHYLLMDSL